MKNLYLQLGLDPNANPEEIEAALKAKPELSDGAAVLLDESRRSAYNRTVSTLHSIGMLRHRLGLDADQSWFVETCPDFAPRLHMRKYTPPTPSTTETATAPAASQTVSAAPSQTPAPGSRNNRPWIMAAAIIFATAVVLALLRVFLE